LICQDEKRRGASGNVVEEVNEEFEVYSLKFVFPAQKWLGYNVQRPLGERR
jgi:hypothetical protein